MQLTSLNAIVMLSLLFAEISNGAPSHTDALDLSPVIRTSVAIFIVSSFCIRSNAPAAVYEIAPRRRCTNLLQVEINPTFSVQFC
ncbi:MAG: hypothetical protein ACTHM6_08020, partial [Tepidisphaeraceae bacterium]